MSKTSMQLISERLAEARKAKARRLRAELMEGWGEDPPLGCVWIPMTRGLIALVDECDWDIIKPFNWVPSIKGYAITCITINGKQKTTQMHRLILGIKDKTPCDHINQDKLDNRRSNLRICSHSQNKSNSRKPRYHVRNLTSKFKGVSFNKRDGCYYAQGAFNLKKQYIGIFDNEYDAARAYDEWARKTHGQFAYLNFP